MKEAALLPPHPSLPHRAVFVSDLDCHLVCAVIVEGHDGVDYLVCSQLSYVNEVQRPKLFNPLNPGIERAAFPLQYIRETALRDQASERFSALTLPRILSVLSS